MDLTGKNRKCDGEKRGKRRRRNWRWQEQQSLCPRGKAELTTSLVLRNFCADFWSCATPFISSLWMMLEKWVTCQKEGKSLFPTPCQWHVTASWYVMSSPLTLSDVSGLACKVAYKWKIEGKIDFHELVHLLTRSNITYDLLCCSWWDFHPTWTFQVTNRSTILWSKMRLLSCLILPDVNWSHSTIELNKIMSQDREAAYSSAQITESKTEATQKEKAQNSLHLVFFWFPFRCLLRLHIMRSRFVIRLGGLKCQAKFETIASDWETVSRCCYAHHWAQPSLTHSLTSHQSPSDLFSFWSFTLLYLILLIFVPSQDSPLPITRKAIGWYLCLCCASSSRLSIPGFPLLCLLSFVTPNLRISHSSPCLFPCLLHDSWVSVSQNDPWFIVSALLPFHEILHLRFPGILAPVGAFSFPLFLQPASSLLSFSHLILLWLSIAAVNRRRKWLLIITNNRRELSYSLTIMNNQVCSLLSWRQISSELTLHPRQQEISWEIGTNIRAKKRKPTQRKSKSQVFHDRLSASDWLRSCCHLSVTLLQRTIIFSTFTFHQFPIFILCHISGNRLDGYNIQLHLTSCLLFLAWRSLPRHSVPFIFHSSVHLSFILLHRNPPQGAILSVTSFLTKWLPMRGSLFWCSIKNSLDLSSRV